MSVIRYGAYFTVLTGALQLLACLLWAVIRNPNPLIIPFQAGNITTIYGTNFWLTLVSGDEIKYRLEVFIAMNIPLAVFWVVTPCSDVVGYQHFKRTMLPPSSGTLVSYMPHHYTVSQPRKLLLKIR
jgi:hypothetical protein